MNSLSDHNLALFCHVFSFLAFDIEADMMQSKPADKKKSSSVKLIEMSLARPPNAITAVDRNHGSLAHALTRSRAHSPSATNSIVVVSECRCYHQH